MTSLATLLGGAAYGEEANESRPDTEAPVVAADADVRWPNLSSGPIQDNSFFIEEAYNQERGVVQTIGNATYGRQSRDWDATVTQEWPAPDQENQLSYTIPYAVSENQQDSTGVGDVLLNYRRQVLEETPSLPVVAPRLSILLPTGDDRKGLGFGSPGVQVLLPFSKQVNEHWEFNLNAGVTVVPAAHDPDDRAHTERFTAWLGGASLAWEPVDAINFLTEFLITRDSEFTPHGLDHPLRALISPGLRMGWNLPRGVQLVVGAALPIGLTPETDDLGAFLYFSVENAFTSEALAKRQW